MAIEPVLENLNLNSLTAPLLYHSILQDRALGFYTPSMATKALAKFYQEEQRGELKQMFDLAYKTELAKQASEAISKLVRLAEQTTDEAEQLEILEKVEKLQRLVNG